LAQKKDGKSPTVNSDSLFVHNNHNIIVTRNNKSAFKISLDLVELIIAYRLIKANAVSSNKNKK